MDELEIYYIVEAGLDKSDGEDIDYNLTAALNSHIREAYQKIFILFIGRVLKYSINTLMFFGVFIIVHDAITNLVLFSRRYMKKLSSDRRT